MAEIVFLPKLGNSVESCILLKWNKKVGEEVKAEQTLCEVETDKTTMEIESQYQGYVLHLFLEEGGEVAVHAPLLIIGEESEDIGQLLKEYAQEPVQQVEEPQSNLSEKKETVATTAQRSPSFLTPRARKQLLENGLSLADLKEHMHQINASGAQGRILAKDIEQFIEESASSAAFSKEKEQQDSQKESESSLSTLSRLRSIIAQRMQKSLHEHAQFTLHRSINVDTLLSFRARLKKSKDKFLQQITLNDLLMFVCVQALKEHPQLNAHWHHKKIETFAHIHLGFAIDAPAGLTVPVIAQAHSLSLGQLAKQAHSLIEQAVSGNLKQSSSQSTFTISNLGQLGIEYFTPILNSPEVAILGIGGLRLQAVAHNESILWKNEITFSLTLDHQALDGADGARFLNSLAEKVENFDLYLIG